jgi:tetratricopeptide (TPR) repeat protein
MERNVFRRRTRLIISALSLSLLAGVAGCSSALDKARVAWSDGEGDFEEAEPLYEEAIAEDKTKAEATEELVAIYTQLGRENKDRFKVADDYYAKALELDPNNEDALVGRARIMMARGMPNDAFALVERGAKAKCRGCSRLLVVLLIERADAYYQAQQWAEAENDYARAMAIIPNAAIALNIVRCKLARKATDEAADALAPAADLIGVADVDQRKQFLELRRVTVLAVLAEDKPERADKLLDLAPSGVGAEEQLDLAVEVAYELKKRGKADIAIDRLETLVAHAEQGKLKVSPDRLKDLRERVAMLYIASSATHLSKGDLDAADQSLTRALELRPGDPSLQLQRVLTIAAKGKLAEADAALDKIDSKTGGHAQVAAILRTIRVHEHVAAGKLDLAKAELDRAKAKASELPEVHVAMAELLSVTEVTSLKKKDLATVRASGLVKYPDGKITRLAEALSELDWSRQSITGLGTAYPYRGPGTEQRIEALTKKISAVYPYKVKFNAAPQTVLVVRNDATAALNATLQCGAFDAEAKLGPATSSRLTIPKPGLCTIAYGGKTATFVAEPYTEVELPLL